MSPKTNAQRKLIDTFRKCHTIKVCFKKHARTKHSTHCERTKRRVMKESLSKYPRSENNQKHEAREKPSLIVYGTNAFRQASAESRLPYSIDRC